MTTQVLLKISSNSSITRVFPSGSWPLRPIADGLRPLRTIRAQDLHQFIAQQIQVGEAKQGLQLRNIFCQSTEPGLPISELTFDDPEYVLHLASRAGNQPVGLLFQVVQFASRFGFD